MNAEGKHSPSDIDSRALAYSVRAVKVFRHLQQSRDGAAIVVGKQYLRSAMSIGANLAEAKAAESKADFIHKCAIVQKEVRETLYWLKLMVASEMLPHKKTEQLVQETSEIAAIVTAILKKAKANRSCD